MSHTRGISYALELPSVDDRAQPREDPCLALGMAVLHRAWIDALDGIDYLRLSRTGSRNWWKRTSVGLRQWCEALGLDFDWVVARAQRRLYEYDHGDQETRTRIRGHAEYWDRDAEAVDLEVNPDGCERTPQAKRQRAYYLRHRNHLLAERKRRREESSRMDARFPGYAKRHAFQRRDRGPNVNAAIPGRCGMQNKLHQLSLFP